MGYGFADLPTRFDGDARAAEDVNALLHLLDHRLDFGGTVLKALLVNAALPTGAMSAEGAPFAAKEALKARGYRWDAAKRHWGKEVADADFLLERDWVCDHVLGGARLPTTRRITWKERYSAG